MKKALLATFCITVLGVPITMMSECCNALTHSKTRRNINAINDIVSTMSKKDKELLNLSNSNNAYKADGTIVVKRFVKKIGNTPVSFLEITGDRLGVSISIGTRYGSKYRNKGYASAVARQCKNWLDKHVNEFEQIVWWARNDNLWSIKIAQKIGFEFDESSAVSDSPWIKYEYKKINALKGERKCD